MKNKISIILADKKSIKMAQENSKTILETVAAVDKQSQWGVYCVVRRAAINIQAHMNKR